MRKRGQQIDKLYARYRAAEMMAQSAAFFKGPRHPFTVYYAAKAERCLRAMGRKSVAYMQRGDGHPGLNQD